MCNFNSFNTAAYFQVRRRDTDSGKASFPFLSFFSFFFFDKLNGRQRLNGKYESRNENVPQFETSRLENSARDQDEIISAEQDSRIEVGVNLSRVLRYCKNFCPVTE